MCKTLNEAIKAHAKDQAKAIFKHFEAVGIHEWKDLTKSTLFDFRDAVMDSVASSSARTYFAVLKSILDRYSEDVEIPCKDYRKILTAKEQKPLKTFLTSEDLGKLEKVKAKGIVEEYVLREFLVSAYTGMRISDVMAVGEGNINGEFLSYVSIKTKVHAFVPLREGLAEMIQWLKEHEMTMALSSYNDAIRRLCKRAGITENVKVFKAGKEMEGPKWQFVSSHTGRISFCTCLSSLGANLQEIRRMAGHTTTAMTERYIVPSGIEISEKAMAFFR